MSVRAIIGFEHLPQNDANWINWATHGITRAADQSAVNQIQNGWIYSVSTTAGNERVSIPLAPYMAAPVNKIWCGVRVRIRANPNSGAGIVYMDGTYLFRYADIPNNATLGTIAHLEWSYDITTGVVERWVNGVALTIQTVTAANRAAVWGLEAKGSVAAQCDWRDIIVMDDQGSAQGLAVGPIGPARVVTPLLIETVTAPLSDWTTNNGVSLAGAVNEPGVIPTTNIATSSATKGTLVCNLKPPTLTGLNVDGIEMVLAGASTNAASSNVAVKLKNGSAEIAGPNILVPATGTYKYSGSMGVANRAPDGTRWNSTNIDSTDFIITPDA